MKGRKQLVSLLMAVVMMITCLPFAAVAGESVNPSGSVKLSGNSDKVSLVPTMVLNGKTATVVFRYTKPSNTSTAKEFVVNATIGGTEKPLFYFNGMYLTTDGSTKIQTGTTNITQYNFASSTTDVIEATLVLDLENGRWNFTGTPITKTNYSSKTSNWITLPHGLSSYTGCGVESVSIGGNSVASSDSTTISNASISIDGEDEATPSVTHKLKLSAAVEKGTVKVGDVTLDTTGIDVAENSNQTLEFIPDANCALKSVWVKVGDGAAVDQTDSVSSENKLVVQVTADTVITAEFEQTSGADVSVTQGTMDEAGKELYVHASGDYYGAYMIFEADVQRPEQTSGVYGQSKCVGVELTVKADENSAEQLVNIIYLNHWKFMHTGESYAYDDKTNCLSFTYYEPQTAVGSYARLKLEVDLENSQYRITLGNGDTGGNQVTDWYDLPSGISDWSQACITKVGFKGYSFPNGFSVQVKNMSLTKKKTQLELVNEKIDALPEASTLNFGNYIPVKEAIAEIEADIESNSLTIDASRAQILADLKTAIETLENSPVEEVKWLIDSMKSADEIDENNFEDYIDSVNTITEKLTEQMKQEIGEERVNKYEAAKAKIEKLADEKRLAELVAALPSAAEIDKKNLAETEEMVAEIKALLDKLGITTEPQAYTEAVAKITELKSDFDRYITMDLSGSFNAKVFETAATIGSVSATANSQNPNYIGTMNAWPSMVLNKAAFEEIRNSEGIIYSNKEVPFKVSTDGGLVVGTAAKNAVSEIEIPVSIGAYEEVSAAFYVHYGIKAANFELRVNYTDGTSVSDPDWDLPVQTANPSTWSCFGATLTNNWVTDYITYPTASFFEAGNSGASYTLKGANYSSVVATLQTDPTKLVKSIYIKENSNSLSVAVLGVTGKLQAHEEVKARIEGIIDGLSENPAEMASDIEDIDAVTNMIEKYESVPNAPAISNKAKYETIKQIYDTSAVILTNAYNATDYEYSKAVFEFKNPIGTRLVESMVTVTINGKDVDEPVINVLNNKSFEVSFVNDLDYDKEYVITISASLPDENETGFTLRQDYTYTFKPTAPMELQTLTVKKDGAETALDALSAGDEFSVDLKLVNNSAEKVTDGKNYAVSICLFDEKGVPVKIYMEQGNMAIGGKLEKTFTFTAPDSNSTIECFILDGYSTMNKIWETVVK